MRNLKDTARGMCGAGPARSARSTLPPWTPSLSQRFHSSSAHLPCVMPQKGSTLHFPLRCFCVSYRNLKLELCDAKTVDAKTSFHNDLGVSAPLKHPDPHQPLTRLRDVLAFNVRRLRVQSGLSQEHLGFAADVDRTFVSQIERSRINVSIDNIEKLAAALKVDASLLFQRPVK